MAPNLLGNSLYIAESTIEQLPLDKLNKTKEHQILSSNNHQNENKTTIEPYRIILVWRNIIAFIYLHIAAFYGLYLCFTSAKSSTLLVIIGMILFGAFGITGGAHRLWAHKSYKAKVPLRIILMIFQTLAFQNSIYEWVRDHRVHHKYTDTNADPHNSKRGFFFSHMGWLLCKKHNDVKTKGATIDMSDLESDAIVMFQERHYLKLMPIFCIVIPFLIPYLFLGESISNSWYCAAIFRYIFSLHGTWLVNSYAHFYGMKPYDKNITPTNSYFVGILAVGEGWHNYHHVFPWDYKAAELGTYSVNFTTAFIDFFAKIGWAYDLKTVSEEMVRKRILRTGDGSHKFSLTENIKTQLPDHSEDENLVWGWDDKDMTELDKKEANIYNKIE